MEVDHQGEAGRWKCGSAPGRDGAVTTAGPRAATATVFCVWLLFLVMSLGGTPIPGVNEPHYLCKAYAFSEPTWCERDFFLQSRNAHYCFYLLVGPLTQVLPFAVVAMLGRAISLLIVAIGFTRLASVCGLRGHATAVAAGLMLLATACGSLSGEWIVGGFESKVPAWGFGLLAISYWLRAVGDLRSLSILKAGLACGMGISLHPVVGLWVAISIAMAELLRVISGRRKFGSFVSQGAIFGLSCLITALPGLIPAVNLLRGDGPSAGSDPIGNYIQVFWRLKHHLDPTEFPPRAWLYTATMIGLGLLATRWLRICWRMDASSIAPTGGLKSLNLVLFMSAIIAAVGIVIGWHTVPALELEGWAWRAALLKFYPFRLFDGLLPIVVSFWVAAILSLRLRIDHSESRIRIPAALMLGVLVLTCITRPTAPGGYNRTQFRDWQTACEWIRTHTPADSLVLTPRESFAFKWLAERAEYVAYKDCPQDAGGIIDWNNRFNYVNLWTRESSSDGMYHVRDLQRLKRETGVDYVLTRVFGPFENEPAFTAGAWHVYQVPAAQEESGLILR